MYVLSVCMCVCMYSCVGIEEHQSTDIDLYHCPNCQPEHGPLTCMYEHMSTGTHMYFHEHTHTQTLFWYVEVLDIISA